MASRHRRPAKSDPEDRFFRRELHGEQAPCFATLQKLYSAAMEMSNGEPWDDLNESEAFFFPARTGELRVGSVSGARGDSMSLQVYRDFATFQRVQNVARQVIGAEELMGEFIGVQNTLRAELADSEELAPPDRALLKALRHPFAKEELHPQFRAIHPGYLPWYVTEEEAQILIEGIHALRFLIETLRTDEDLDFWSTQGSLPLVEPNPATGHFSIRIIPNPAQPVTAPVFTAPPQEVEAALALPQSEPDWATDHIFTLAPVGDENQRPFLGRVVITVDPQKSKGLHIDTFGPQPSLSEAFGRSLLACIRHIGARPGRLLVDRAEFVPLLEPLASALHIKVVRRRRIRALEDGRLALLARLLELDEDEEFDEFDDDVEE